jgi:hypothetical protein
MVFRRGPRRRHDILGNRRRRLDQGPQIGLLGKLKLTECARAGNWPGFFVVREHSRKDGVHCGMCAVGPRSHPSTCSFGLHSPIQRNDSDDLSKGAKRKFRRSLAKRARSTSVSQPQTRNPQTRHRFLDRFHGIGRLGQRFLISNHIKRPRRVCRTRCGRLGSG